MKSGKAARVQEALLPQIVVASTEPAGMPPPTNCIATQPQAISEMAIQTPPARKTTSRRSRSPEISIIAMASHSARHGALDDFLVGLRGRLLVARLLAADHDMDEIVRHRDEEDDEAAGIAELRNPERHRHDAAGDVVELPGLPGHHCGMPGEEAGEAEAEHQREHLEEPALAALEMVD